MLRCAIIMYNLYFWYRVKPYHLRCDYCRCLSNLISLIYDVRSGLLLCMHCVVNWVVKMLSVSVVCGLCLWQNVSGWKFGIFCVECWRRSNSINVYGLLRISTFKFTEFSYLHYCRFFVENAVVILVEIRTLFKKFLICVHFCLCVDRRLFALHWRPYSPAFVRNHIVAYIYSFLSLSAKRWKSNLKTWCLDVRCSLICCQTFQPIWL